LLVQVASGYVVPVQPPQFAKCSLCSLAAVNNCHNCHARICSDHIRMTSMNGTRNYDSVQMCPKCDEETRKNRRIISVVAFMIFVGIVIAMGVVVSKQVKKDADTMRCRNLARFKSWPCQATLRPDSACRA
jgi:hypothetical protein